MHSSGTGRGGVRGVELWRVDECLGWPHWHCIDIRIYRDERMSELWSLVTGLSLRCMLRCCPRLDHGKVHGLINKQ